MRALSPLVSCGVAAQVETVTAVHSAGRLREDDPTKPRLRTVRFGASHASPEFAPVDRRHAWSGRGAWLCPSEYPRPHIRLAKRASLLDPALPDRAYLLDCDSLRGDHVDGRASLAAQSV